MLHAGKQKSLVSKINVRDVTLCQDHHKDQWLKICFESHLLQSTSILYKFDSLPLESEWQSLDPMVSQSSASGM